MTIIEVITQTDRAKPNTYTQAEKIRWLSALDGQIKREIIDTHCGAEDVVFHGYDEGTPVTTVLLVPAPYDELYLFRLESMIDYSNREYDKYNNSVAMFNAAYASYAKYYNRTHKPRIAGRRFVF